MKIEDGKLKMGRRKKQRASVWDVATKCGCGRAIGKRLVKIGVRLCSRCLDGYWTEARLTGAMGRASN